MSAFDLNSMTLADLLALEAKIKAEVLRARERSHGAFKVRLDALLAEYDMVPSDLAALYAGKMGRSSRQGVKVAIKYRNPDDPRQTWSGRGRQPRWLAALTLQGRRLEDFRI
jgi:DNA-binding protein H-NS